MWTYRGINVYPADRNASGVRWIASTGSGMKLRADTKEGMRQLIRSSKAKRLNPLYKPRRRIRKNYKKYARQTKASRRMNPGSRMITFADGMDSRSRIPKKATVAKFVVKPGDVRYVVIGTSYGHARTSGGDVRTWKSYSGARKYASSYKPF